MKPLRIPTTTQTLARMFAALAVCMGLIGPAAAQTSAASPSQAASSPSFAGDDIYPATTRLQQQQQQTMQPGGKLPAQTQPVARPSLPYQPGEFERFVQALAGREARIRRFGAELVSELPDVLAQDISPMAPPDYVLAPGDEVLLTLWGSVDADLRLMVDRGGRIAVPRVGSIQVAGVRQAELAAVIERRVAQVFRNFQVSVSLGQLRGIRVFVTGFVVKPGTYTVSALSTVVGAMMQAGGPSAAGSFRQVELRRNGALVAGFDLYDLLLKGNRSADRTLQGGDVVHVGPVGTQVGVIGSVNQAAVFELAPGEGVADALRMAGGFSAVADRSRLSVERLQERTARRVAELALPRDAAMPLSNGDVLFAFSAAEVVPSTQNQNKRVRVDGEVLRPGEYVLPPGSTLQEALRAAGGLTSAAFIYGTQFTRDSVRQTQQENYDRALRDLETDITRAAGTQRVSSAEQAASSEAQAAATSRLLERLRALKPSGRVVLSMATDSSGLPELLLEDGDRLYVPPKPSTVGVFGSVFNTGSYLHGDGRTLSDYLRLAGGPTKGADESSIFVVRANGQVISGRQRGGDSWFRADTLQQVRAEPGDTLFVPEEMDKTTFVQAAKDWTQILYQFGIGIAGIVSASR